MYRQTDTQKYRNKDGLKTYTWTDRQSNKESEKNTKKKERRKEWKKESRKERKHHNCYRKVRGANAIIAMMIKNDLKSLFAS